MQTDPAEPSARAAGAEAPCAARAALAPLRFLLGAWAGEGSSYGAPITGELEVALCLNQTFVEARERLFLADGSLDHEDRAFYRHDAAAGGLVVLHLQAPAWTAERRVEPLPEADGGGLLWDAGALAPRVLWRPFGQDRLLCAIFMPGNPEPTGLMRYHRRAP